MRKFLQFVMYAAVAMCAAGGVYAREDDPRAIETQGALTRAQDGQISTNIWNGVTRDEALELVEALPMRFSSPVYYSMARDFLLSDAPPFPAEKKVPAAGKDKKKKDKTGDKDESAEAPPAAPRPDLLIARIDKLLAMGGLREARALYDAAVDDTPADFDLAYRSLEMLMLRGQVSAACLDTQAMKAIHGSNPRWKDFNKFCRIQFAAPDLRSKLLTETNFDAMPELAKYLKGEGLANLPALGTEQLAYAVALGEVTPDSISRWAPKAGAINPLLLSVLVSLDTPTEVPQKTCLAIEGLRRGLLTTRDLITLYEKPHYDSALLLDEVGTAPSAAQIHPCLIPTVLYQRIASNLKNPDVRDRAIREALDVMKDLPDAALWPMALYFEDFDIHQPKNKPYLWRVARIVAYEKDSLPEAWSAGWGKSEGVGVSPFWPIEAVMAPRRQLPQENVENLKVWKGQWPSESKRLQSRDPLVPLLLSSETAGGGEKSLENAKSNLDYYEKVFSLTFSRSYAMPSYGLTQRLKGVIEKGQTGLSVALLLIGYGAIPPDQVIPHQMALVISGMNGAGFAQDARRFALEVLQ